MGSKICSGIEEAIEKERKLHEDSLRAVREALELGAASCHLDELETEGELCQQVEQLRIESDGQFWLGDEATPCASSCRTPPDVATGTELHSESDSHVCVGEETTEYASSFTFL